MDTQIILTSFVPWETPEYISNYERRDEQKRRDEQDNIEKKNKNEQKGKRQKLVQLFHKESR